MKTLKNIMALGALTAVIFAFNVNTQSGEWVVPDEYKKYFNKK